MNPIGQLITFIATVSIIAYFLMLGYFLRRIMLAVEDLAGTNHSKIVKCSNCGKKIQLGSSYDESSVKCPVCNNTVPVGTPLILQKEEKDMLI